MALQDASGKDRQLVIPTVEDRKRIGWRINSNSVMEVGRLVYAGSTKRDPTCKLKYCNWKSR